MTTVRRVRGACCAVGVVLAWGLGPAIGAEPNGAPVAAGSRVDRAAFETLKLAIVDLIETFGARYPRGREYLFRLDALEASAGPGDASTEAKLSQLKREALRILGTVPVYDDGSGVDLPAFLDERVRNYQRAVPAF